MRYKQILIFILIVLAWQFGQMAVSISTFMLPTPYMIITSLFNNFSLIAHEGAYTVIAVCVGLCSGAIFAIIMALLMSYSQVAYRWAWPLLMASQVIPTFAIAPLIILWFGFGIASKIIIVMMMVFFPIASNFYDGLENVNTSYLLLANSLNASKLSTLLWIKVPAARAQLYSGLKIAAITAPMGAIIGEWIGSTHGIGNLMLIANARMQVDLVFACILVLAIFASILSLFVNRVFNTIR